MSNRGFCSKCACEHPVSARAMGKIVGGLLGAIIGGSVKRNPGIAILSGLLGAGLGAVFDEVVIPRCPACGTVLQIIAAAV